MRHRRQTTPDQTCLLSRSQWEKPDLEVRLPTSPKLPFCHHCSRFHPNMMKYPKTAYIQLHFSTKLMSNEQIFAEKFNFFHSKKQNKTKFCLSSGGPRICGSKCMCDCLIMNKRQNTSLIHSQYHHQREIPRRLWRELLAFQVCKVFLTYFTKF